LRAAASWQSNCALRAARRSSRGAASRRHAPTRHRAASSNHGISVEKHHVIMAAKRKGWQQQTWRNEASSGVAHQHGIISAQAAA